MTRWNRSGIIRLMEIILDGERSISWNKFYSGMHWTKRREILDDARAAVLAVMPVDAELFSDPVEICITVYFKSRPQDPDNICTKLYIDALKGRLIQDDDMRYVSSVTSRSRIDKAKPRVEIEIRKT